MFCARRETWLQCIQRTMVLHGRGSTLVACASSRRSFAEADLLSDEHASNDDELRCQHSEILEYHQQKISYSKSEPPTIDLVFLLCTIGLQIPEQPHPNSLRAMAPPNPLRHEVIRVYKRSSTSMPPSYRQNEQHLTAFHQNSSTWVVNTR